MDDRVHVVFGTGIYLLANRTGMRDEHLAASQRDSNRDFGWAVELRQLEELYVGDNECNFGWTSLRLFRFFLHRGGV